MIIRGIRSLTKGYMRDLREISDTEENVSNCVMLESDGENVKAEIADDWPDTITLDASISATAISSRAAAECFEDGRSLGKISLYQNPKIDTNSAIQSVRLCCESLSIKFEGTGTFRIDNETHRFIGREFSHFKMESALENLFEKKFMTETANVVERCVTSETRKSGQYHFYAYGGFFKYGAHPKQIEPCVCRIVRGRELSLRISPVSELLGIGISDLPQSQKMSLYDELKNGACSINIKNALTAEQAKYVSNMVSHISGTNLITVNFTKE